MQQYPPQSPSGQYPPGGQGGWGGAVPPPAPRPRRTGVVVGLILGGLVLLAVLGLVATLLVGAFDGAGRDGPVILGNGYDFQLPDGWSDQTSALDELPRNPKVSLEILLAPEGEDPLLTGRTITVTALPPDRGDDLRAAVQDQLNLYTALGYKNVELTGEPRRTELAGREALTYDFRLDRQGQADQASAVITLHKGRPLEIAVVTGEDTFERARTAHGEVLDTWHWR
jgi:hypothetical protein